MSRLVTILLAMFLVFACDSRVEPARTGVEPADNVEEPAGSVEPGPAVAEQSTGGPVLARIGEGDGLTGRPRVVWRRPLGAPISADPAVANGTVLVGRADYTVQAVDLTTGTLAWVQELSFLPVWVSGSGSSFVVSGPSTTISVRADDGEILWSVPRGVGPGGATIQTSRAIYLGTNEGEVIALGPESGEVLWSVDPNPATDAPAVGLPGATDGVLYVTFSDGLLVAVEASSGSVRWSRATGSSTAAGPVVRADGVYVAALDGTLSRVARPDGAVRPVARIPGSITSEGIATDQSIVWVDVDSTVTIFNPGDESLSSVNLPDPVFDSGLAGKPALLASILLAPQASGFIAGVDPATGAVVWVSDIDLEVRGRLWRYGSLVVAGGAGGEIAALAFDVPEGTVPLLDRSKTWSLPADGRFRIQNRAVQFGFTAEATGIVQWSIQSDTPDDPVVVSVLTAGGRTLADNMGKVELEDRVRASLVESAAYILRVERPYPDSRSVLTITSQLLD